MKSKGEILVVEDNKESLSLISNILATEGYRIIVAGSSTDALSSSVKNPPNLILLELYMPAMNALDVLRRLKESAVTRGIPVILLSSDTDIEKRIEGLKLGAVDFIPKPFQQSELLARVQIHLEMGKLRATLAQQAEVLHNSNLQLTKEVESHTEATRILKENEQRYRALIESAPIAIYINRGERVVFVNKECQRLFGASTPQQLLGKSPYDLFHPGFHSIIRERISNLIEKGIQSLAIDEKIVRLDGKIVDVEVIAAPFRDQGVDATHVMLRDISERKQSEQALQASEDKFRAVFEKSTVGKSLTRADGKLLSVNKALADMFGYSIEELLKLNFADITHPDDIEESRQFIRRLLSNEIDKCKYEKRYIHKNGSIIYTELSSILLRGKDQQPLFLITSIIDNTERKKAENALKESKGKLDEAQKMALLGYWSWDIKTGNVEWSEQVFNIFRLDPGTFKPQIDSIMNLSPWADDHQRDKELIEKAMKNHEKGTFEQRFLLPDKSTGYYFSSFQGKYDSEGKLITMLGTVQDITERKKAQEALNASELKYRRLFEAAKDGILILDAETGMVMDANPFLINMLGYSLDQFKGKEIWELGFFKDTFANRGKFLELQQQEYIRYDDLPLETSDGRRFNVEFVSNVYLVDKKKVIQCNIRDITERKQTECKLKEMYEQLNRAQRVAHIGSWEDYLPTSELYWSEEMYNIMGFPAKTPIKISEAVRVFPPEELERFQKAVTTAINENTPYSMDYKIVRLDSSVRYIHDEGEIIRDKNGKAITMFGTTQDITERKQAEDELGHKAALLEAQINSSADGILIVDPQGKKILQNKRTAQIWKIPEYIADNPDDKIQVKHVMQMTKNPEHFVKKIKYLYDHPYETSQDEVELVDGTILGRYSAPVIGKDRINYGRIWYFHDLTDRKKMEDALIISHKLDSLGVLAGGIAHDFNNILTGIIGNISIVKYKMDPGDKLNEMLNEAEKAAFQAKTLTQQLLTFSKGGAPVKKLTVLSDLLRETSTFASRGSKAKCDFKLASDLNMTEVDPGQIGQVISNIIINAVQAMPEGGDITIQAGNIKIDKAQQKLALKAGNYVYISIKDTGNGIPSAHLAKIFDPYFTTKQTGSGLGLATCYSIIKKHEGYISVESEMGKGSIFTFYLPAYNGKGDTSGLTKDTKLKTGRGRVLVMDDDKMICSFLKRVLTDLGYAVETAFDGTDAASLYAETWKTKEAFDIVILDLTIPGGKGGIETLKNLRKLDPNIVAIVSSGYSNDPILADYSKHGFAAVLPKPYDVRELSEVLYKLLKK